METVNVVQLVLRQTCVSFMTFIKQREGGTLTVSVFRSSKYVSSFFWRLVQRDDSSININIQVHVGIG